MSDANRRINSQARARALQWQVELLISQTSDDRAVDQLRRHVLGPTRIALQVLDEPWPTIHQYVELRLSCADDLLWLAEDSFLSLTLPTTPRGPAVAESL